MKPLVQSWSRPSSSLLSAFMAVIIKWQMNGHLVLAAATYFWKAASHSFAIWGSWSSMKGNWEITVHLAMVYSSTDYLIKLTYMTCYGRLGNKSHRQVSHFTLWNQQNRQFMVSDIYTQQKKFLDTSKSHIFSKTFCKRHIKSTSEEADKYLLSFDTKFVDFGWEITKFESFE